MKIQNRKINLSGMEYEVTEADGQLLFKANDGMSAYSFAFEWTGTGWYFLPPENWMKMIPATHLAAAIKWIQKHYVATFKEGQGTVKFIP